MWGGGRGGLSDGTQRFNTFMKIKTQIDDAQSCMIERKQITTSCRTSLLIALKPKAFKISGPSE